MVINKATGERYQGEWLGSTLILVSSSTGVKRVCKASGLEKEIFTFHKREIEKIKTRSELEVIPDLVRSLQLEINYLERRGQKVFLKL